MLDSSFGRKHLIINRFENKYNPLDYGKEGKITTLYFLTLKISHYTDLITFLYYQQPATQPSLQYDKNKIIFNLRGRRNF